MYPSDLKVDDNLKKSSLYSHELAPIPHSKRTWNKWNLAALWVGMAVCIPTYLLASYMMRAGLSWQASIIIIGLANLVITVPMALNGHAGVKYGIPFPVIGRASFGTKGIHLASIVRAIVACGWFGVQTWIGGLAIYSIVNTSLGLDFSPELGILKFACFFVFWLVNIFFIWKGTESIRWLEDFSAPILILIGILLIGWGLKNAGNFTEVLQSSVQLQKPTVTVHTETNSNAIYGNLDPIRDLKGDFKATHYQISIPTASADSMLEWTDIDKSNPSFAIKNLNPALFDKLNKGKSVLKISFKDDAGNISSAVPIKMYSSTAGSSKIWDYILWFTAMVGFWATMAISISDITRYAKKQSDQIQGQFIGLPGTMIFYSFVGIFVTSASILAFPDVLVSEDAPWDPVSLVAKFKNPGVVIFSQIAMLIATLSTNIAANVIAPANAFSNLLPQKISFRKGGIITGLVGILICPWWLMDEISSILIFVSGLLGPVLGILMSDYFIVNKKTIHINALYDSKGIYSFGGSGINKIAIYALAFGVFGALIGFWVPSLSWLYSFSWFTGFFISFGVYAILMKKKKAVLTDF